MEQDPIKDMVFKGRLYSFSGLILGIYNYFTPETVEFIIRVGIGVGSIVSLFFGIRYHIYATREKKENLKRLKEDD